MEVTREDVVQPFRPDIGPAFVITLKVPLAAVQQMMQAIGQGPYNQVQGLISQLNKQLDEQLTDEATRQANEFRNREMATKGVAGSLPFGSPGGVDNKIPAVRKTN